MINANLYATVLAAGIMFFTGCTNFKKTSAPVNYSGIYPHLAYYNDEGECGTGAVVPWADRLWVVTYGPHLPFGSSDKLYEITPDLKRITFSESIGGTPANRMIHKESNQLFIGPYIIGSDRNIKVISSNIMPGRLTGNARHLADPEGKIYYATMEEGFYEADVNTLHVNCLYKDTNTRTGIKAYDTVNNSLALLKGDHGKGFYSGQGVLVYSNNGELSEEASTKFDIESGSLSEWNGKDWKLVRRNQFVEVTGPGGIYGNTNPETDPIWVTGWDYKSLLIGVRDKGKWSFFRLPKASHSYDGAHGWNTEWPRIRDVGTPDKPYYLMTMHGMFWSFPGTFSSDNSSGIRPLSAYLKIIGDYTRWNNILVFGCDDSANKEFLNKRKVKGNIEGPGQSNSNLWFTSLDMPGQLGPNSSEGAVWISEKIKANESSEPFLFKGWENRSAWVKNEGENAVIFTFYADKNGNNNWNSLMSVSVKAGESVNIAFAENQAGEWIKISADKPTKATVHFWYTMKEKRSVIPDTAFAGLSELRDTTTSAGLLWGLGNRMHKLGVLAGIASDKNFEETGYYELDSLMNLVKTVNREAAEHIREKIAIPENVIRIDSASVVIDDDQGRRWRLPKGDPKFSRLTNKGLLRICREVATERDLFNCAGTFYELPAENADGFAKIRPITSHNFRIYDYASYRGMLIMTGIDNGSKTDNYHIIRSIDGKASVWAGTIDDLWRMGKPVGEGGPWLNSIVMAGVPSDPYLIAFYNNRTLMLSHNSKEKIIFGIEVDPIGNGHWMHYKDVPVDPGETNTFLFPDSFQARWIRFITDKETRATAYLKYE
jgi:hypothetical protein